MAFAGQFAGGMVFPETLVTPLLKTSLATALSSVPYFAGRAVFRKDGRLDVDCSNAGSRFVAASTSAKLADVVAALDEQPYGRTLANPWGAFWPPSALDALVRGQWPLSGGFVLHLSGGGSILWVAAHHCLADFESLQTLVAHWAQAYNEQLRATGRPAPAPLLPATQAAPPAAASTGARTDKGGAEAAGGAAATPHYLRSVPEARRWPKMSAAEVEALAADDREGTAYGPGAPPDAVTAAAAASTAGAAGQEQHQQGTVPATEGAVRCGGLAPPPGEVPPRREVVLATWWSGLRVAAYLRYHMLWRGGGVETRVCRVSAQRLAQLKAQAVRELREARGAGQVASPQRQMGDATAPVEWVSTNDALTGRLLQVLHSLPLRRPHPMSVFMAADVRRRLTPPLPPSHIGNLLYSARLAGLRPAESSLGALAASVRRELNCHLVPQFRGCLARSTRLVGRMGPRGLVFAFCLEADPGENIFAPEGPVNMTRWDVQYELWQFGPSCPLAFLPAHGPGVLVVHPAAPSPAPGSEPPGAVLTVSMHRACWQQLDAAGSDLGAMI